MMRRFAVLALTAATVLVACGDDKPADGAKASAEPAKSAEAAPPPVAPPPSAAPSAAPAADSAAPAASGAPSAAPDASGKPGEKGAKGDEKGEKKEGGEKVVHLERAHMEFNKPGEGWEERKKGEWVTFHPKDKTAILAFVEFEKRGEATKDFNKLAEALELTDLKWKGAPKKEKVGPDHLEAEHGEGTCKFATTKHEGEIEYYTVDGAVLIAAVVEEVKGAAKKERLATKTIESLRKVGGGDEKGDKGKLPIGKKHH